MSITLAAFAMALRHHGFTITMVTSTQYTVKFGVFKVATMRVNASIISLESDLVKYVRLYRDHYESQVGKKLSVIATLHEVAIKKGRTFD